MRRLLFCPFLAVAALSFVGKLDLCAQTAKAKAAAVTPRYDPPDQPFRMAPMPQSTRSIVVPLATNLHLAFDTALLRTHTVWSGRGLALLGPQYGLPKSPFISTNDGTVLWTMPPVFPWAVGKRPDEPAREMPKGARFFAVNTWPWPTALLLELPTAEPFRVRETPLAFGNSHVVRHFEFLGKRDSELWFLAHAEIGVEVTTKADARTVLKRGQTTLSVSVESDCQATLLVEDKPVRREVERATEAGAEKGHPKDIIEGRETRVWVRIPTASGSGSAVAVSTQLGDLPAPANLLATAIKLAASDAPRPRAVLPSDPLRRPSSASTPYFKAESFSLPKAANLLITGMDFLPNGDLAVCTWNGEVWFIEKAQGPAHEAKYRRFARGLGEPMGLVARDNKLFVGTKLALIQLTLTDNGQEAKWFAFLNQSWGYTGSYNAFSYGPVFDKAGNFILANAGHSGRWDAPYMGWGIRISPDGAKLDAICSGFREPNGIGTFGPDRDVFVSENQGQWMAACKLNHVAPGKLYGHPSAWPAPQEEYGKHTRFDPPAVWFPYKLARSTTGICEITDDRFGPFKGQLMVGDFQNAIVTRVQLEKVNGEYQGAVWPFLKQFQSGVNRLAYGPDGKLYVGGCQAPISWKAVAPLDFALERISYTGRLPFEVKEVHALRDGFELTFTQPVEEKAAANPDSYDVTQYGYKYHAKYGSPEFDHDGKENAATVIKIAAATVSPDKLKVRLKLEGWKTGYVTMVRSLDVKNAAGDSLVNDTFWYTLNQLPK
ncbi:MAG: Glucose/sorbosone dehydrogenase-like protein [Limisphaerales bacterium]|nr:MAG: Glucose/sorbosone dehydrogenase-like protein [Limisphaerales bacterium]KAG0510814.1 MAG: Glucose/sorbosone dehydrogenase-like protein [Limisphaerales bacterium]TXT52710.1 MAG: Glucose/sorbosone dehydrogenase-like protein [Limisphaerales bacterium]